nr:zinc finger, CCHC-type [Tanacetum cinerariifolium]
MHFLLSSMRAVHGLTTPISEDGDDDATVEQIRKRAKWDNDDYICKGLILKDFKHTLKHKKDELTLVELGSHLRIEESFRAQDSDKPKGNNIAAFMSTSKLNDSIMWYARLGHVHFKRMQDMSKDGLILTFDMDTKKWNKIYFVTFIDDASRGIKCIFVGYVEHSKAFRFFVIEPNESVSINSIIESMDAIFDENRFSSVPSPSLRIPNGTKDIGGLVVLKEVIEEVLYERHGEVDVILGIRIKHESNGISIYQSHYIEKVLKKFNYFDCTSVSAPMDTSKKLMPNNGHTVSQLEYSRVIGCLMYSMTYTRPDIAFVVVLEGYTDASWINNTEDNSSTSGWVFLLGGAISWASKKQTCITGSTIKSEFMALATAGKEAEWLKNLLLEIPLWSKPIAPSFIRCDSVAT